MIFCRNGGGSIRIPYTGEIKFLENFLINALVFAIFCGNGRYRARSVALDLLCRLPLAKVKSIYDPLRYKPSNTM
jgi:hypothetical protein